MKYLAAFLFLFSSLSFSQTVINEVYVPYTNGYTFNDQLWERAYKD